MVNERITEIERTLIELIHEKKKCMEYQENLRFESFQK